MEWGLHSGTETTQPLAGSGAVHSGPYRDEGLRRLSAPNTGCSGSCRSRSSASASSGKTPKIRCCAVVGVARLRSGHRLLQQPVEPAQRGQESFVQRDSTFLAEFGQFTLVPPSLPQLSTGRHNFTARCGA